MHQVHIHFLHIFMFHHIEGEEIHPWKDYQIQRVCFIKGGIQATDLCFSLSKHNSWGQSYFPVVSGYFASAYSMPKSDSFLFCMWQGFSHMLFQRNDCIWTWQDHSSLLSHWKGDFPEAESSDPSLTLLSLSSCSCPLPKEQPPGQPGLSLRGCQTPSISRRSGRAWVALTAPAVPHLAVPHPEQRRHRFLFLHNTHLPSPFFFLALSLSERYQQCQCNHVMCHELYKTPLGERTSSWFLNGNLWHWPCNGSLEFASKSLSHCGSKFIAIHLYTNLKRKPLWGHTPLTVSKMCYRKLEEPDFYFI